MRNAEADWSALESALVTALGSVRTLLKQILIPLAGAVMLFSGIGMMLAADERSYMTHRTRLVYSCVALALIMSASALARAFLGMTG